MPSTPQPEPVRLSHREWLVAVLTADGQPAKHIALQLGIELETVKSYLRRARLKYWKANRRASTKIALRRELIQDGRLKI